MINKLLKQLSASYKKVVNKAKNLPLLKLITRDNAAALYKLAQKKLNLFCQIIGELIFYKVYLWQGIKR